MSDITSNKGATNYSVQPGYSKDYPPQGTPMDPANHSASNVPTATEHHDGTVLKDAMKGRWDYSYERDQTQEASDSVRGQ